MPPIHALKPIFTAHLLGEVESLLIGLLDELTSKEWQLPTIVPKWNVKNIAAHLLDMHLRKLSLVRDGYFHPGGGPREGEELPMFVNRLNAEGVDIYSRLSSEVLVSLMKRASIDSSDFHLGLDPMAPAQFAVSWAGESESLNWFDTARELTERWHHQQQIRLAVGKPGLMTPRLYHPVLDTFMRALPFHYRDAEADPGTLIRFIIPGECGGAWNLYHDGAAWQLIEEPIGTLTAEAQIPPETAWRIFTKGIAPAEAGLQVLRGNERLARHILTMISIVA